MEKYVILDFLGEGTYGTVTKCMNESTGSIVAMKKLRSPLLRGVRYSEIIIREINLLRFLNNEHIVPLLDVFRVSGYIYMVFPYIQSDLFAYLENNDGPLTMNHTRECVYQVLKGVRYIHSHNVIHRDIKPENILVTTAGIIKICDFGASRKFNTDRSLDMSTEVGTLWYQAPEMLMEKRNYNTMVDIWSIGILFTELVDNMPLVTQQTADGQLCGIFEILGNNDRNTKVIIRHLRKHGIDLRGKNYKQQPLSKSYMISNTALALRKVYPDWPTLLLEIVSHCLQLNPADRMNAAQLLDMEYFTIGMFNSKFDIELEKRQAYDKIIENKT